MLTPRNLRPARSIIDLIGNTPVVELTQVVEEPSARLFAKLESLNPGGSVKDRLGIGMIRAAEKAGLLQPGATIVEPTAGNTGIALALAGVRLGYKVILVVPENFSIEKQQLMRALGGTLILTSRDDGMKGAIARAEEIARTTPGAYLPQQFRNPSNSAVHYETTGPELFAQLEGRVDAFVCGSGTGGTFTGVSRYLKERSRAIHCVIVEPQGSVLQGGTAGPHEVEGIGASFIPEALDMTLADEFITVTDTPAFAMVSRLAAEEGILSGSSGGAAVHAAVEVARRLGPEKVVATIIPDSAERYLSKGIFSNWADADPNDG
ncbi:MAG TPA: cysteine synthase A [Thermoanaerobaculia bacterium]|nr:cysteine synthase A [Thermoanaerobaculia bacterium]